MRASPLVCANRALLNVLTTLAGPASHYMNHVFKIQMSDLSQVSCHYMNHVFKIQMSDLSQVSCHYMNH